LFNFVIVFQIKFVYIFVHFCSICTSGSARTVASGLDQICGQVQVHRILLVFLGCLYLVTF